MKLWDFRNIYVCPLCNETENNLHVVRYIIASANTTWFASLENLEETLLNNHIPPSTATMIVNQLILWRGDEHELPSPLSTTLNVVIVGHKLIE